MNELQILNGVTITIMNIFVRMI